jgi:putative hydrolase of the HAD superfamily
MKLKALIFDLNGTIIDTFSRPEYETVLREMAEIVKAPYDEFTRIWMDTFEERISGKMDTPRGCVEYICNTLSIRATEAEIEHATQVRLEYTARHIKPRPGAVEVITRIKSSGYKTGLISDCTMETPKIWPETAFAPLFDVTVFSCLVGIKKPDPRIYLIATKQLGVTPEECMYIGDGDSNELTGALQGGMYPVMIRVPDETVDSYFVHREEKWEGPVIKSLWEVLDLL